MSKKDTNLSQKQQVFVREYLRDGNGARAAIAAGYSAKSASVTASRMLRNAKVREKLAQLQARRLEKIDISGEKVLQGIAQLAFFDLRKLFHPDGTMKAITELDDETVMALRGVDLQRTSKYRTSGEGDEKTEKEIETRTVVTKVRLADRGENLERLGRHLKLFGDTPFLPEALKITIEHIGRSAHPAATQAK